MVSKPPAEWTAAPLFSSAPARLSCLVQDLERRYGRGNICMSLSAGPMVTLATALEARYTLLPRDGRQREVGGDRLRHRQPRQCA